MKLLDYLIVGVLSGAISFGVFHLTPARAKPAVAVEQVDADFVSSLTKRLQDLEAQVNSNSQVVLDTVIEQSVASKDEPKNKDKAAQKSKAPRTLPSTEQRRVKTLMKGGFTEEEAREVMLIEDRLLLEQLQEKQKAIARLYGAEFSVLMNDNALEAELGPDRFERFVKSRFRNPHAVVKEVLFGSEAYLSGLQPGDRILKYDGQRVYSDGRLMMLEFARSEAKPVTLLIERDGAQMEISAGSGPLGVNPENYRMMLLGF